MCTLPYTVGHPPSAPPNNEKTGAHGMAACLSHRVAAEEPRAVMLFRALQRCVGPSPGAKGCCVFRLLLVWVVLEGKDAGGGCSLPSLTRTIFNFVNSDPLGDLQTQRW